LEKLRQDYPRLPLIIVEDALSANAPHLAELKRHNLHFILGVKPGGHKYLFAHVAQAQIAGQTTEFEIQKEGVTHRFRFLNDVLLNESNADVRVNFLQYWEVKGGKTQHFTWITDFTISKNNAYELMRGGRARWKIENETFNSLIMSYQTVVICKNTQHWTAVRLPTKTAVTPPAARRRIGAPIRTDRRPARSWQCNDLAPLFLVHQ